jgi:hypothetical protein
MKRLKEALLASKSLLAEVVSKAVLDAEWKTVERAIKQLGKDEVQARMLDAAMDNEALFQDKYYGDTEAIQDIFDQHKGLRGTYDWLRSEWDIDVLSFVKGTDIK